MYFEHSPAIWTAFPELVAGVLIADGIGGDPALAQQIQRLESIAAERLSSSSEGDLPEIQAWRRTFSRMGLKPTQYRCASESLLRRFRKEGSLPSIHPLIDLCNAVSLAYAIPIAVFDTASIVDCLQVRHATGEETYLTFSGDTERPDPGEVIFADAENQAHARRWTNRQSRLSAVQPSTSRALIVAEALHPTAARDVPRLLDTLTNELKVAWPTISTSAILNADAPRFDF
ncbi:MAG TPA: phenylalanine--tRNA ligase beta subunit-related protein [Herpetosiphonaceae bacterium]